MYKGADNFDLTESDILWCNEMAEKFRKQIPDLRDEEISVTKTVSKEHDYYSMGCSFKTERFGAELRTVGYKKQVEHV